MSKTQVRVGSEVVFTDRDGIAREGTITAIERNRDGTPHSASIDVPGNRRHAMPWAALTAKGSQQS